MLAPPPRPAVPRAPRLAGRAPGRLRPCSLAFSLAAVGAGAGRALTTTYLPLLLERIDDAPTLIGAVMTVNAVAGFGVPIVVGIWSDRRGRRLPFIAGGAVLTAGGLVAVGLGNASSYVALGLAAALLYTGLNALTTAHRAIVAEDVEDGRRPAATSAQELAGLVGAVVAVAIGGALIEPAPGVAFALAAAVLGLTAVPTLVVSRRLALGRARARRQRDGRRCPCARRCAARARARSWSAQTLWVFAYAALPAFFVLYAEDSLGLGVGIAGALPLGFGALTAIGMVLAGRARPERVHPLLLAGAALLGAGLLAAAPAGTLAAAALPFAAAALGAGLLTALGFPYFARFVPEGEAGRYSGLFFAGRAVAAGAALPLAGLAVELSGTYRAVLWLGAARCWRWSRSLLAERGRPASARRRSGRGPLSVAAVMPVFASDRAVEVARSALVTSTSSCSSTTGRHARSRARWPRSRRRAGAHPAARPQRRQGQRRGGGRRPAARGERPPEAIVVLDSDGQHDPGGSPRSSTPRAMPTW